MEYYSAIKRNEIMLLHRMDGPADYHGLPWWLNASSDSCQKEPLEKEMATHSSILAWEIPWTEQPSGLQFMGSQKELDMT